MTHSQSPLTGKVALVTGGARGIGFGIAKALVSAGARVMIGDLGAAAKSPATAEQWAYSLSDDETIQTGLAELNSVGSPDAARAIALDVTRSESCEAAVAATLAAFGRLDLLCNNAGIVQSGAIEQFSEALWDQVFAVNTKGPFLMTKAALGALKQAAAEPDSNCAIINTASIAGKTGYPNMSAYCGSKFAAIGITQALAAELAPSNIRVNALCPGMVGTAMWLEHLLPTNATDNAQKDEEFEAMMARTIPLGRPQSTEDMGAAVLYLATAPNVTGIALNVAGGFEMH
ncbi:MAG: SDR family NAD(P)-dependent oxidoreductase [Pseudomonadales bacterium]